MTLDDLPVFVVCPDCPNKHILTLNHCVSGKWSIAYVDMSTGEAIAGLALNDADTVEQACIRLGYALQRYMKRNNGGQWTQIANS